MSTFAPMPDLVRAATDATSVLFEKQPISSSGNSDISFSELYGAVYKACLIDVHPYPIRKLLYSKAVEGFRRLAGALVAYVADPSGIGDFLGLFNVRAKMVESVYMCVEKFMGNWPRLYVDGMREAVRAAVAKFGSDRLTDDRMPAGLYPAHPSTLGLSVRALAELAAPLLAKVVVDAARLETWNERESEMQEKLLCMFAYEVAKRQARIRGLLERWRSVAPKVGKMAAFVNGVFTEVHFRPSNEGFRGCKRHYEDTLGEYEPAGDDAKQSRAA